MGNLQRHTLLNSNLGRRVTLDCGMRPMPTSGDVHARRHSTSAIPGITRARLQAHLASLEQAEQAIVRELTALRQTFASTIKVRTDELRSTTTPAAPGLRRASAPTASCTPSAFPSPAVSASAHSSRSPQAQPRAVPQLYPQYCPKPQPQQPQQQWAAAGLPRAPPVPSSRAPQPPQPPQPVSVSPQLAHQLRSYIASSARAESPARRTERPPAPPAPSQWPARPQSEPMDVPAFQARPASASVPRGWASPVGPSPGLQRPPSDMAALTGRPNSTLSPGGARW
ncbi:hypothetical protein HYH03_012721 [Edaphochlamys debaryana]|uniref:Uncharacterized protein n=1 Tax=Edaphochlamys debaryana TaxID=47281 RepID=A0A835XUU3_9CHLO|nr:hypothetical protein HYH03_012721 [Edaphochlamys debaryana]|eukprot:KAG2488721.1 hypothetical protein HYH03_012721 [Edaphochlamys debaryana]